jgi:hypothetical protein
MAAAILWLIVTVNKYYIQVSDAGLHSGTAHPTGASLAFSPYIDLLLPISISPSHPHHHHHPQNTNHQRNRLRSSLS